MTHYLQLTVYEPNMSLNSSDQITVPGDLWTQLDTERSQPGPIYVAVGEEGGVIGRIIPATPCDALFADTCRIPEWMWMRLGAPEGESWLALSVIPSPPAVDRLVLRAQKEAALLALGDPVTVLTECLSGSHGASWSCLTEGIELQLECGSFDVVGLYDVDGEGLQHGSILDTDVKLEFVPALDHVEPTPAPPLPATPVPQITPPFPQISSPYKPVSGVPRGFMPFSGTGRRLGGTK